ncbi:hypothetical protein ACA910_008222 [Epithemia clementina (nom. ined.)]
MAPSGPDASNAALPAAFPVIVSIPPVPSCERGERCALDGKCGRVNNGKSVLAYPSGKNIVIRNIDGELLLPATESKVDVLVYRGHAYNAVTCKLSPSGAWVASGDDRGRVRIWAFDHENHLCKYECHGLTGPVRDIDWDFESKRIVFGGEKDGAGNADCARAIQWDTGVSVGQLAAHLKGRVTSVAFKPSRPFKLVTAGKDDHKIHLHKGPPFQKVPPVDGVPEENAHTKGAVFCVRYNNSGNLAVSVGTDRSICSYEAKEFKLLSKLENVHSATIYSVAWADDDKTIMTSSGDGTCKLFEVAADGSITEKGTWKPAEYQLGKAFDKVPVGGNQLGCAFVNGSIPVCAGLNGQICVLPKTPAGASDIRVLTGHYAAINALGVDVNGKIFFTGDTDGILCEWDLMTGKPIGRLLPPKGNSDLMYVTHGGAISGMTVAPATKTLYTVGWDDKVFVTQGGKVQTETMALAGQPSAAAAGNSVVVICTVKGLQVIKGTSSISDLIDTSYTPQAVCVTKDDKTVYVGGSDSKIHIYSVGSDKMSLSECGVIADGHRQPIHSMALSNDESKLASADVKDVCVFDLKDGNKPLVAKGRWCFHMQRITCLSWSNDDKVIASGSADDSIYLWCIDKLGKRIHYQFAHRGGITGLSFLSTGDGTYKFLSVGVDSVVNQWDATGDVEEKFQ